MSDAVFQDINLLSILFKSTISISNYGIKPYFTHVLTN